MENTGEEYLEFNLTEKAWKFVKVLITVTLLISAGCLVMYFVTLNSEPDFTDLDFSLDIDETKFVELEVEQDASIYYRLESDEGMPVRLLTKANYENKISGKGYSYIEDDYGKSLDLVSDPLDAGTYVIFIKGDDARATGTLSYGVQVDNSGQANVWLVSVFVSILVGAIIYLIFIGIAGRDWTVHRKRY